MPNDIASGESLNSRDNLESLIDAARADKARQATTDQKTGNNTVMPANTGNRSVTDTLVALRESAMKAQQYSGSMYGDEFRSVRRSMAIPSDVFLATENLPSPFDKDGRLRRTPRGKLAATTVKLETGMVANSRVAQAGAHVAVYPDATKARATGATGVVVMERRIAAFRNTEAAAFETVTESGTDGGEYVPPVIDVPVFSVDIDWEDSAIIKGVRFELPRSAQKAVEDEVLYSEISTAIILGVARAADEVLLSALSGKTLAEFSLANAAAQGLRFDELRALAGTSGTGAEVSANGALRVAGVPAELTGDMAGTIVGAWGRAGVAVSETVTVFFERLDLAGKLAVTAWVGMLPLVPDASKFWKVSEPPEPPEPLESTEPPESTE